MGHLHFHLTYFLNFFEFQSIGGAIARHSFLYVRHLLYELCIFMIENQKCFLHALTKNSHILSRTVETIKISELVMDSFPINASEAKRHE